MKNSNKRHIEIFNSANIWRNQSSSKHEIAIKEFKISHQQEEEVIETLPLSVHVEDNNLITGGFNNWPESVLINLRHLADTDIRCF